MERGFWQRSGLVLGFLAAVMVLSYGVYRQGLGQAMAQIKARGQSDIALAEDRLTSRLRRYQELAVMMADHPDLSALIQGGERDAAESMLRGAADKTGALALYYTDFQGRVLAGTDDVAEAAALRGPWVTRARQGALGTGHGRLSEGKRAYFFAAPFFNKAGKPEATLLVVVDIDEVEFGWRSSRPAVFFTDAGGEIFISNRSELLFATIDAAAQRVRFANGREQPIETKSIFGEPIWQLDLGPYIAQRGLHLVKDLPVIGMRAEALVDITPAERLAGLQAAAFAAVCVAFGAILFLVTERRRALVFANQQLEGRVEARTAELRRTQAELVQAGKLSALGQMSAGISHELNQPLMAIQQFAQNGQRFLQRGDTETAGENLSRIAALSQRAGRIIKNLRAFSRNEHEPMGCVDLVQVLKTACELTGARLKADGVTLDWPVPNAPVYVLGGEVRLEQVFVNLINNAADAMGAQVGELAADKSITIAIRGQERLKVSVRDTGPGIADTEKMFDPFYTTKEVGGMEDGMGLGLSISYGLVQSFGGNITGRNTAKGAEFTVELERWKGKAA
ncbi:sensor histidine kinase [Lentibacter algarum]|uniref:sensor histidine kinase n=1 Tax=Lentibacter algarum TaxID=576131 RepID=UPI001C084492|nr:ATP-binding protein [Lentibacter algarum]MBU2982583.1 sensor histidine kinase [Lentibacter algarum]